MHRMSGKVPIDGQIEWAAAAALKAGGEPPWEGAALACGFRELGGSISG